MLKDTFAKAVMESWPTLVIFLVIVTMIRIVSNKHNKYKLIIHEEIMNLFFITYILLLFELVTSREISFVGINLVPFKEILRYDFGTPEFYSQVIGNIILFIPFGFFASYYSRLNKIGHIAFMSLIVSLTIEVVQKFIGRSFDVDDMILNVIGGIIGSLIFIALDAIRKKLPKILQNEVFYNLVTVIILVVIAFCVFSYVKV